ncbi:unnamed protein product [Thlaspi arvense]|uniref:Uncharacterized protein n=1 Tax=Thlaspi arvense TaxID=13288 RepID=A0AAU9S6N8_THLAR|nr:unnamed protein product [Thlaspi arvense]
MRYIRTGSFKRLFSIKRRSLDEEPQRQIVSVGVHNDGTISKNFPETEPPQRPTWKCFSYEEIFEATNGFSSGSSLSLSFALIFSHELRTFFPKTAVFLRGFGGNSSCGL